MNNHVGGKSGCLAVWAWFARRRVRGLCAAGPLFCVAARLLCAAPVLLCTAAMLLCAPQQALAQRKEPPPPQLENVGITEKLDAPLPLQLEFVDSQGREVLLERYFDGRRPVILTLNYSNCPMLCSLQLNGLVEAMRQMSWDLGDKYQVVTVSIDPQESHQRADLTKQKYLRQYGRPGTADGWHFLVGREENIRRLADAVGFGYAYIPQENQYAHLAVLIICTPDGRIARYLPGIKYDRQTLHLSLLEASQGKIGSPMERLLMYCFHYDAQSHRYGLAAMRLMRWAAGVVTVLVGGVLIYYWRRELRKSRPAGQEELS